MIIGVWQHGSKLIDSPDSNNLNDPHFDYLRLTFNPDGKMLMEDQNRNDVTLRRFIGTWNLKGDTLFSRLTKEEILSSNPEQLASGNTVPFELSYIIEFKIEDQDTLMYYSDYSKDSLKMVGGALKLR